MSSTLDQLALAAGSTSKSKSRSGSGGSSLWSISGSGGVGASGSDKTVLLAVLGVVLLGAIVFGLWFWRHEEQKVPSATGEAVAGGETAKWAASLSPRMRLASDNSDWIA